MRLLVVGVERVDAGKTTFGVGLVNYLDATGFKPRAGNDYWFDYDDYRAAVDDGRLYGKDAKRLVKASGVDDRPESINPVHRLWRPAPEGDTFLGPANRTFVLDRAGDRFVVNAAAGLPESARANLPIDDALTVESLDELNRVTREVYLPLLDELADEIKRTDRAVVESYGDVARPLRDFAVDRVAAVEPGRARIYDGYRFNTACQVTSGSPGEGSLEERVGEVTDLIDPLETVELPPLTNDERADPDAVADRYAVAYDAMV